MQDDIFHFLDFSRHFWQDKWNAAWKWFGNDEFNMAVWGSFIVSFAIFWIIGLSFLVIDLTGKPKFLLKYRIQKTSKYPVKLSECLIMTQQILLNQVLCGIPAALLFHHALKWRGYDSSRNLPGLSRIALDFLFFITVQEIGFYYMHRLLHTPVLFRHIHEVHHKWKSPIAITAMACHPLEHVFANMFPILLGPFLLGSHLATVWLWFSIAILSTMISHSGFKIPQIPHPEIHDLHHSKSSRNYGTLGIMDRLHGTT